MHPDHRQLKSEADRFAEEQARFGKSSGRSPTEKERVESQRIEDYRRPFFLTRTATPEQITELNQLLEELWATNQRWVGERVLEVAAYYTYTGEHTDLERRFVGWSESYMGQRADPSRVSPQVKNDTFLLSEQLVEEWDSILGRRALRQNTVDFLFLRVAGSFTQWLLFDRLWKHRVILAEHADFEQRTNRSKPEGDGWVALDYGAAGKEGFKRMRHRLNQGGWLNNYLEPLLKYLRVWASPQRLAETNALPDDVLRERIQAVAHDIQEMRPFLIHNFRTHKTTIQLTPDRAVAWRFVLGAGIASLIVGDSVADVRKRTHDVISTLLTIRVGYDGLFYDFRMPWHTTAQLTAAGGARPLALNFLLLESFRDLLHSFYKKINLNRIKQRLLTPKEDGTDVATSEDNTLALAVACRTLAETKDETSDEAEHSQRPACARIPVLRLLRLLRVLEGSFGCEISQGKGSEVNIFRPGGRIYTAGCHKRNPEVRPYAVKRMLNSLNISVRDFLAAVFG